MRKAKRVPAKALFKDWQKDPSYREAYDALEEEFSLASATIEGEASGAPEPFDGPQFLAETHEKYRAKR